MHGMEVSLQSFQRCARQPHDKFDNKLRHHTQRRRELRHKVCAKCVWESGEVSSSAWWVKDTVDLIQRVIFSSSAQKLKGCAKWGVCCKCMQIILNQMKRQISPRHVQRQPHNGKSVHIYTLHTPTRTSTANNVLNFTQDNPIRSPYINKYNACAFVSVTTRLIIHHVKIKCIKLLV